MENFVFRKSKIEQGGLVFIFDDKSERDKNWNKDLCDLEDSLKKSNFEILSYYNIKMEDIIFLAKNEKKLETCNSIICIIIGHISIDKMRIILDAFEQCETLKLKPKIFFNQTEKKTESKSSSNDTFQITVNFNVMKYLYDESIVFYYRHDLNNFFFQNLSKVIETERNWMSFHDLVEILNEKFLNSNLPKIEQKNSYDSENAKNLHDIAIRHWNNDEYDKALSVFEKELELLRNENISNEMSVIALKLVGDIYYIKNNLHQAYTHYIQALETSNKVYKNDDGLQNRYLILKNLGALNFTKNDFENAIFYYEQAVKIQRKLYNNLELANSLHTLGVCCLKQNQEKTAIVYITEALDIKKRLFGALAINEDSSLKS